MAVGVFLVTSIGSYFLWSQDSSGADRTADQTGREAAEDMILRASYSTFAPDADTFHTTPGLKGGSLAGIYRPNFRGVVAERAQVIVATGGLEPLSLGAYVPYH